MLELACASIVTIWWLLRLPHEQQKMRLIAEGLTIAALAWAGEQTCIALYGFYSYAPRWQLMAGHVPLMVVCIWPVVVISARDLIRRLVGPDPLRLALGVGLLVLADAAFIEPAAGAAGLWQWFEPGLLGVPPAGILGWAVYAALVVHALEHARGGGWSRRAGVLLVLPGLHVALLSVWWLALRWVSFAIPSSLVPMLGLGLSVLVTAIIIRRRVGVGLPLSLVLLRLPGALFFAALLAVAEPATAVIAWAAAFVPPWLALMIAAARSHFASKRQAT